GLPLREGSAVKVPALPTRVSRADWDEHDYFRWKLFADLGGKETLAGMLAVAVTGMRLDPADREVIDDVASINAAADPRIWPLKVVRVASAYGRILPAVAVGALFFESDTVGSMLGSKLARVLVGIRADLGDDFDDGALEARVRTELGRHRRLPGF